MKLRGVDDSNCNHIFAEGKFNEDIKFCKNCGTLKHYKVNCYFLKFRIFYFIATTQVPNAKLIP